MSNYKHMKYKFKYLRCRDDIFRFQLLINPPIVINNIGGIDWTKSYNIPLNDTEEKKFTKWIKSISKILKRDLLKEMFAYDFRIFWLTNVKDKPKTNLVDKRGHFSDIGKKPNHITFSTQSFWDNALDRFGCKQEGGVWKLKNKKWTYTPSQFVIKIHGIYKLTKYFAEYEKKSELIIKYDEISFPEHEIPAYKKLLDEGKPIHTHRILYEYGKYKLGHIYHHPKLGKLKVVSICDLVDITHSPIYTSFKNWTKKQQKEHIKYGYMNTNHIVLVRIKNKHTEIKEYLPYTWKIDKFTIILDTGSQYIHMPPKLKKHSHNLTSPKGKLFEIKTKIIYDSTKKNIILIGRKGLKELQTQGYVIGPYKNILKSTIYIKINDELIPTEIDTGASGEENFSPLLLQNNKLGNYIFNTVEMDS